MKFEFDSYKSESNKIKHGIDFVEAQQLWKNQRVEVQTKVEGEMRYAALGTINNAHYTVIISYRGASVRIISARPSTEPEKALYEKHKKA